jgi:transglutaminase-like putative cysteine protease
MMASSITALRRAQGFLRSIAVVVCIAFTMLILTPTVVAARQLTDPPATSAALAPSDEATFARTLERLENRLEKLEERLNRRLDAALDVKDVNKLKRRLERLDARLVRNFAKVRRFIQRKQLPVDILLRHETMVDTYQAELDRLIRVLSDVETITDDNARLQAVKAALAQLRDQPHRRSQQPFDPSDLPNQGLQPNPGNKPKDKPAAFSQAGLHSNPLMRLAALGDFTFDHLPGASDPAYLAATTEVTLSDAITAKAAALNHDPIQIYNWVRNHVEWLPSWGAYQSADLTLGSRRGNAMDISSLLIALLRASHIPARYVHGTIELPAEAFTNWAGDFATVAAAIDFVSAGGIPVTSVLNGGRITKVRVEHLWVEAALDFHPYRGAVNQAADSWIALDPSFKQYEYREGLDVLSIAGLDAGQLGQSFVESGTVNEAESWVTGFNAGVLETAQTQAQSAVQQYIDANLTEPTVGDIIGGRRTIVREYLVLPSGLPYKPVVTGARYGKLPPALQHRMSLAFERDLLGDLIDSITLPWAKVNNQKLTLSFDPATDADQEALAALLPDEITDVSQIPYSIPAYLIRVVPVLRLNGHIIHQGNSVSLGEEVPFSFDVIDPTQGRHPYTSPVIAGSYLAVPVVAGSLSPLQVARTKARMEQTRAALDSGEMARLETLTRDDILGDVFYLGGLGYFAHYDAFAQFTWLSARLAKG